MIKKERERESKQCIVLLPPEYTSLAPKHTIMAWLGPIKKRPSIFATPAAMVRVQLTMSLVRCTKPARPIEASEAHAAAVVTMARQGKVNEQIFQMK